MTEWEPCRLKKMNINANSRHIGISLKAEARITYDTPYSEDEISMITKSFEKLLRRTRKNVKSQFENCVDGKKRREELRQRNGKLFYQKIPKEREKCKGIQCREC